MDEALGFARAFGVSLDSLLLPQGIHTVEALGRFFFVGLRRRNESDHARARYQEHVRRVAAALAQAGAENRNDFLSSSAPTEFATAEQLEAYITDVRDELLALGIGP